MILPLQTLRGIFVILIFLSHFKINGTPVFPIGGDMGVAFFFMLSGLVLRLNHIGKRLDYCQFLRKRIVKIYPLHVVCLAAACLIGWQGIGPFVLDLSLVQSWIPDNKVYFSLNSVAWYLSTLLFLYLLFPLFNRVLDLKIRKQAIILYFLLLFIYLALLPLIHVNMANYWVYVFPPSRIFDMVGGMLLADALTKLRDTAGSSDGRPTPGGQWIMFLLSVGLLILGVAKVEDVDLCYRLASWWWLPNGLLIATFVIYKSTPGLLTWIFSFRPLVWFGDISFSFFLTHLLVIRVAVIIDEHFALDMSWQWMLAITFCATTMVSYLTERFIVNSPMTKFRR